MPSLPEKDQSCNPHFASLVAINIVTQVIDEAQDVINKANDSGQSWRSVWRQNRRNNAFYESSNILGITDTKNNDCNIDQNNVIVTSTPQKESGDSTKDYNDKSLIGQGDEDIQMRNTATHSPSMLINCLFDLSDLEQGLTFEVTEEVQNEFVDESGDILTSTVTNLLESYINLAINTASSNVLMPKRNTMIDINNESGNSSFSLLDDALVNENVTFYIENEAQNEHNDSPITQEKVKMNISQESNEGMEEIHKKDIDLYEQNFATLNRDYDKCSEEEYNFQDNRKSLIMQEVELPPNVLLSSENIAPHSKPAQALNQIEQDAVPSVKLAGANKGGLVKRCRLQGARIMSRLRSWWWKQRLIRKRKQNDICSLGSRSNMMPGICPLSPKARSRTASLLDHRNLKSPSPTGTFPWKFNTVNEAIIHAYNRKEFDMEFNSNNPEGE